MKKTAVRKPMLRISEKKDRISVNSPRWNRIEQLKEMIENEEYVNEAIQKLAGSLTTGLMK